MFLRIDSSIRNWVFIPVTLITICVSLLMKYLTFIFNQGTEKKIKSSTKSIEDFDYKTEIKNKDTDIVIKNAINRANLLKNNFMYISEKGFKQRKAFFCKEETGFFSQKYESKNLKIPQTVKHNLRDLYQKQPSAVILLCRSCRFQS